MPTWSNLWKHTKWDLLKISFLTGFILASYNIGVKKYSGVSYASGFLLAILDAYYISPLVSTTYKWASTPRSFIVPEDMPD